MKQNAYSGTIIVALNDNAKAVANAKYNGTLVMTDENTFTFTQNKPKSKSEPREELYRGEIFKVVRTARPDNAKIEGFAFTLPQKKKDWEDFGQRFANEVTTSLQAMIKATKPKKQGKK